MKRSVRSQDRAPWQCFARRELRYRMFLGIAVIGIMASPLTSPAGTNGTWTDAVTGGVWSNSANWTSGAIANGTDGTADFSTLNISADDAVHLDSPRTIGGLLFGDITASNNWILDSNATTANTLTLATSSGMPTITVNNQFATLNLSLAGTQGIQFRGNGTFLLPNGNAYNGGSTIAIGTTVHAQANTALGAGTITVNDGGELDLLDQIALVNSISVAGAGTSGGAIASFVGGGSLGGHIVIQPGGATFFAQSNIGLALGFNGGIDTGNGNVMTLKGSGNIGANNVTGTGSIVLRDAISASLSGTGTFSGGIVINNGCNLFTSSGAALGSGPVTVMNGGSFGSSIPAGGAKIVNPIFIAGSGTPGVAEGALNSTSMISGPVTLTGAAMIAATSDFPATSTINTNGFPLTWKSLGGGDLGSITGSGNVMFIGARPVFLSSANSYTGGTVINGPQVNAGNSTGSATGSGPVVVTNGGSLGGAGTVTGAVSTVSQGLSSSTNGHLFAQNGVLKLTGGLTLDAHTYLDLLLGSTPANSTNQIAVTGDLNLGPAGTLNMLNGTMATGTYKLISYTGSLTGSEAGWTVGTRGDSGHIYSFSTATPHEFDLIVSDGSPPANVSTWAGNSSPTNNWTTASNWVGNVAPVANNSLVFTGNIGTSNNNNFLSGTQFNGITFNPNTPTFLITGNSIALNGDLVNLSTSEQDLVLSLNLRKNVNFIGSYQIDGVILGSFGVTVYGNVSLSATNSFTGGLSVPQGSLRVSALNNAHTNGPMGNISNVSLGGANGLTGTLAYYGATGSTNMPFILATGGSGAFDLGDFSGPTQVTLSGLISGGGALSYHGVGSLTLSAANTYGGGTTISGFGANLLVGNATGSATGPGPVSVISSGSLGGSGLIGGPVTVYPLGRLSPSGGGTAKTLSINNMLTLNSGIFLDFALNTPNVAAGAGGNDFVSILGSDGSTNGSLTLGTDLALTVKPGAGFGDGVYHLLQYNGPLTDNSGGFIGWTRNGVGHNFSYRFSDAGGGRTFLDLVVSTSHGKNLIYSGEQARNNGQTETWDNIGAALNWVALSSVPSAFLDGDQATFADSYDEGNGPVTISSSKVVQIQSAGVRPASVTFNNSSVVYVLSNVSGTAGIGGTTGLLKQGTATLQLSNANSFTGQVLVNAGRIIVQNNSAFGNSSGVFVSAGGAVELQSGGAGPPDTISIGAIPLSLAGDGVSGAGALNSISSGSAGTNTYSGAITIQAGGARIGSAASGQSLTLTGGINAGSNPLTFTGAGNIFIKTKPLTVGANGSLINRGAGTVEIDAASSLGANSSLQINAGTLRFQLTTGAPTVGAGVIATVASGATLELAGSVSQFNQTVNSTNNSSPALGGILVSGTNQQLGSVAGSGSVSINTASDLTASQLLQGPLVINGTGRLILRNSGSPVSSSVSSLAGAGSVTLNANNLVVGDSRNLSSTWSGAASGTGGLTKAGTGAFMVAGTNTYTGPTTVNAGVMQVTGSLAKNGSDSVYISAGTNFLAASLVRRVPSGGSFAGLGSTAAAAALAIIGTSADIRAGTDTNGSFNDVVMQWRGRNAGDNRPLMTDILNLTGMSSAGGNHVQTDPFVLQMSYPAAPDPNNENTLAMAGNINLVWLNTAANQPFGAWQNAVLGNFGSGSPGNVAENFQGSWDTFASGHGVTTSNLGNFLGSFGVDVSRHQVWAVINHNSQFAVVPEPDASLLLLIGALVFGCGWGTRRLSRSQISGPPARSTWR